MISSGAHFRCFGQTAVFTIKQFGSQETVLTADVVPMIQTLQTQIVALAERIDNMQAAHCHTAPGHPVPAHANRPTSQTGEMPDLAGSSGQPPQASGTAASNTAHREGDIMAEVAGRLMELGVEECEQNIDIPGGDSIPRRNRKSGQAKTVRDIARREIDWPHYMCIEA